MRIKARIAQFGDFLSKKFDSVRRVAENDGLVDLEFGKKGVKAMDLLFLFNEGVVLGNSPKGKFIHQIDFIGIAHMFILHLDVNYNKRMHGV